MSVVVNTKDVVIKGKKCSAKVCVGVRNPFPRKKKGNVRCVQDYYANLENILNIR